MIKDQGNRLKIARFLKQEQSRGAFSYGRKINEWRKAFPQAKFKVVDFKSQPVSAQPIGVRFLEVAGLTHYLTKQSLLEMIHPKYMQKSIHPILLFMPF